MRPPQYTMLAMRAMAEGAPVDEQREKRWPNRTMSSNPKVELQEHSDVSDEFEGYEHVDDALAQEEFDFGEE